MDAVLSCLGLQSKEQQANTQYTPELKPLLPKNEDKSSASKDVILEKNKVFTVFVTGMGAYPKNPGHDENGHYAEDDNTSHLLTKLLPSKLAPFSKHNPTFYPIHIVNPTSIPGAAVKSEYAQVRQYCKSLWQTHGNDVDLILHLGMADGWEWYSIEKSAWKEGTVKSVDTGYGQSPPVEYYVLPDDIGRTYKDIPGACPWNSSVPEQLFAGPGFDIEALALKVQKRLNRGRSAEEFKIRPHPDSGNYLCGFITYESLAQRYVGGYKAKTLFCHIPGWRDKERLEIGTDFVCELIGQVAAGEN